MNEFDSMTDLGTIFEVTSHKLGKWLVAIGLRTSDNKPSQKAFDEGFAIFICGIENEQFMPSKLRGISESIRKLPID